MQKARAKISVLLIIVTVIAACVLHFFQLHTYSDGVQNQEQVNTNFSFIIYLLIFLGFVLSAVYSSLKKMTANVFELENGRSSIFLSSILLSISFFYDFIHQGYNCYSYISGVSYVEYAYIVPLAITCLFALVSCFYFITFAMSAKNENYDFRNFTFLHFSPVIWAFSKLLTMMIRIVDIRVNIETFCEFILICVMLGFFLSLISAIDKQDSGAKKTFVFFSCMLTFMSSIVAVPRMIEIVLSSGDSIGQVSFSSVTYLMLGIFSLVLLVDLNKRSEQK